MNTLDEVVQAIRSRRRWAVCSHARPDGDAVGSTLGAVMVLRAMGLEAEPYLADGVPFLYRWLPGAGSVQNALADPKAFDGVLVIECDSFCRAQLPGIEQLFSINLDHHGSYREFADVNYVLPKAAAAAELVYHVAKAAGVAFTREMATCLYTAVLTDTGSFCYSGTSAQTFAFAREMTLAGADPAAIAQEVYFSNPASKMHLLGCALRSLRSEGPISWMHVTEADMASSGATEADCEGIVNWALGIHGVEATAFFRESGRNHYRVSLRSKGVDVRKIAESFGGGGHTRASGHGIDGPLEQATARVLDALRQALAGHTEGKQNHVA